MAGWLERLFYKHAKRILAITKGLQDSLLERGYPKEKVPLLTNGVDPEMFHPEVTPDKDVSNLRPDNGILVVYAGTHGLIYSLDTLLHAADKLRHESVHFVLIGDGADKPRLLSIADRLALPNVTFRSPRAQADMPHVFRAADVCVLSLKDLPISSAIMPVKCFEIMACGIPIVFAARGEMAGHIELSGGGVVIEPEQPDLLADALRRFAETGDAQRIEMGRRAREYVVEHFSRDKIVSDLESIMHETLAHGK
jgi:glycosyltransferase involved in cell wall biosynthesis